jgi:hypothetical protein
MLEGGKIAIEEGEEEVEGADVLGCGAANGPTPAAASGPIMRVWNWSTCISVLVSSLNSFSVNPWLPNMDDHAGGKPTSIP